MFKADSVFSGFSVGDIEAAKQFYGEKLGLEVEDIPGMGMQLKLPGGGTVFVYHKPDHSPASFTILNFVVVNIDAAVDELVSEGVVFEQYDNEQMHQDEKGIARGREAGMGPDIAWFKDPAGNILSVLQN